MSDDSSGDFEWFYQRGKVYSDREKSRFTKYVNLHLGRAYEVMSPKDYCELSGVEQEGGTWIKPSFDGGVLKKMVENGFNALHDAFEVIKSERDFNIFNSETQQVEEFNPDNAGNYSQGQCAIVIERVFSRLYKYLQFKSTPWEKFQRHLNIDSGYKYLSTQSILESANPESGVYYSEDDVVPYLRYALKLDEYLDDGSDVLSSDEKNVLRQFRDVLSTKVEPWIEEQSKWNLCPVNDRYVQRSWVGEFPKRREATATDETQSNRLSLTVFFDVGSEFTWDKDSISVPDDVQIMFNQDDVPVSVTFQKDD